ncbi:pyridoxal-phosphate dependent enzyme [Rhodohalobacter sp. SW132]|uniref:threonine ammonia-lyase n=1 Tax=Rhodohalobacter sp. SW132 TaxID=2293433 RepID=UPI000E26D369|nr:pyridoxal-phosphate dependent enzyme [Rhodohalobacter sp. SW132]REL37651.1 pyridoxal-phosphate dependent enzyme [Rhodohalobacter sp. SW132]
MDTLSIPNFSDIIDAAARIKPYANRTPVLTSRSLSSMTGVELFFKCENFQRAGAFKFRGACNAVFSLPQEEAEKGVATHSSGNHGQSLALAAKLRGIPAHIVMPENSPKVKVAAVKGYGAEITFCEPNQKAREQTLDKVVKQTGASFIHPYDHEFVIAGQGTAALELLEEIPDLDVILTPVGGGGLMSGTSIAARHLKPGISVIGTEPEKANDAWLSLQKGERQFPDTTQTVADGLRTTLSERTFRIISEHVDSIATVSEESIIRAMRLIWERMNIIIEPSCAVPFAAVHDKKIDINGKKAGIILTGGNVDLDRLPWQQ